jgi:hypothetical protein
LKGEKMTYIKIDDKPYLDNINLRKILSVSGDVIGSYDIEVSNKGVKTKTNIVLDKNVFELTKERYPEIIDNICHNGLAEIEIIDDKVVVKRIIKKSPEIKFQENKNKKKNDLLNKSKNDPDFVFGKKEVVENYEKLYSDIDNAVNDTDLNKIII